MNDLIEDIKLFNSCEAGKSEDKISVNGGTHLVNTSNTSYNVGSFIPKDNWRLPTTHELALLFSHEAPQYRGLWINLLKIPQTICNQFGTLRFVSSENELIRQDTSSTIFSAQESLTNYLRDIFWNLEINFFGIGINRPGLITVTRDEKFHGLHIDSCNKEPLQQRVRSNNRFLLNIGQEARYFLFINLTVQKIFNKLVNNGKLHEKDGKIGVTRLSKIFMETYPEYPVFRIRLNPGEAYIAPTENIIHDGSTLGLTTNDIYITTRSKFDFMERT